MVLSWRKWTPVAVAVIVVAGVAVAVPVAANASVSLPSKTPAQVLELVQSSKVTAFSGEITETSDLGLPSLPASAASGGGESGGSGGSLASDLALLTGTNSLRLYVDGAKNIRLQDLGSLSEQDVIRHGNDLWTYDSKTNMVEHATITAPSSWARGEKLVPAPPTASTPQTPPTPEGIANDLLAKLAPTSAVSVDDNLRVAGRPAYDLVLTPRATDTLVGSVSIAVDAQTGLPLQVQIAATGQKTPAVSVGFTSLNLATPDASLFAFTPPAGASVKELTRPTAAPTHPATGSAATKPMETIVGTGWDAVVTVSAADGAGGSLGKLSASPEFGELTTSVSGGRILHTTLFNVLFTSDGRIVAGAVSVARLEAVAAQ